ncbi:hypothetical protein ACP4OV_023806 [Aristida adscensionis]
MATERPGRRGDKRRSKRAPRREAPAEPTSVHDVPSHLLELILLRLDSPTSLLRAAAACKRWCRVVADTAFLSRFRSLHTPYVAGHYHAVDPGWADHGSPSICDRPVFLPSPSAAVDSRRFSLDFLPHSDSGWNLADGRGSLLLLFKKRTGWAARTQGRRLPDLVVCEPVTRRCQGILSPGEPWCLGAFLLDGDNSGGRAAIGMSSFKVVAVLHEHHASDPGRGMPVACVFSSGSDGGWRLLPSAPADGGDVISLPDAVESVSFAGRANGSFYWVIREGGGGAMLALDEATMAFSRVPFVAGDDFSGSYDRWNFRVIGGGGALRVVRLVSNELQVLARLPGCGGGEEWVVEKMVRLPEATRGLPGRVGSWYFRRDAMIVAANEAYVLVTPQGKTWLFSVELETLEVEREHERNKYPGEAFPCQLPWPPALEACADRKRQKGRR